jgi:hypothetical protein
MSSPWIDLLQLYNRAVMEQLLQQPIPSGVASELKILYTQADELSLALYLDWMRDYFRKFAAVNPNGPVEMLVQWGNVPCGVGAVAAMRLWVGELLALAHPKASPSEIQERAHRVLNDRDNIWDGVCLLGRRQLWSSLSQTQIAQRLRNWLADHVAVQIWGSKWMKASAWPETARTRPHVYEQRKRDTMTCWETMTPHEAVRNAELEMIFDDLVRQAVPNYVSHHPLAVAVKQASPQKDMRWCQTMSLIFALVPIVKHQGWNTSDILTLLLELHPDLRNKFLLNDASARDDGCRHIRRRFLEPIGFKCPGSPVRPANHVPRAMSVGHLIVSCVK